MSEEIRRMRQKFGSEAQWASANPILSEGEIALKRGVSGWENGKVGDGSTPWNSLPYSSDLILDAEPKVQGYNDQRGLGAYSLLPTDRVLTVLIDAGITVPAGLPSGFRCFVVNADPGAVAFTVNPVYTTVIGDFGASLPGDGYTVVEVFDSSTLIVSTQD